MNIDETELQQIMADIEAIEESKPEFAPVVQKDFNSIYEPNTTDLFVREPLYYSQKAIVWFSVLFGAIFGAALLAINLKENKSQSFVVALFGLLYWIGVILLVALLPNAGSAFSILLNGLGGLALSKFFWPKYIGKDVQYRAKPIWIPLIIAILIVTPIVIAGFLFSGV